MVGWVGNSGVLNVLLDLVQHVRAFVHHLRVVAAIGRRPIRIAEVKGDIHAATRRRGARVVAVVVVVSGAV